MLRDFKHLHNVLEPVWQKPLYALPEVLPSGEARARENIRSDLRPREQRSRKAKERQPFGRRRLRRQTVSLGRSSIAADTLPPLLRVCRHNRSPRAPWFLPNRFSIFSPKARPSAATRQPQESGQHDGEDAERSLHLTGAECCEQSSI